MFHFNYNKLLNDARWILKREEIIERDKCCQRCESVHRLEVHHIYYLSMMLPWMYPNEALITLCHKCHKKETIDGKRLDNLIIYIKSQSLFSDEIIEIFFNHLMTIDFEYFNVFDKYITDTRNKIKTQNKQL